MISHNIAYRWVNPDEARELSAEEFGIALLQGKIVTLGAQVLGVDDREFEIVYQNGNTLDNRKTNLKAFPRMPAINN